jgi:hypothetical protein
MATRICSDVLYNTVCYSSGCIRLLRGMFTFVRAERFQAPAEREFFCAQLYLPDIVHVTHILELIFIRDWNFHLDFLSNREINELLNFLSTNKPIGCVFVNFLGMNVLSTFMYATQRAYNFYKNNK